MFGWMLCRFNRHRPKPNSRFRGDKGAMYGECIRCRCTIRLSGGKRWVRKRSPLTESELDAQAIAKTARKAKRSRRRSS